MTELSDVERAALADPVVLQAVTDAKTGDRSQLTSRPLGTDETA